MSSPSTALRFYDTATRATRTFVPRVPGTVGIYVCGLTVQSEPHVGHVRSAVNFDVLRRWLLARGYDVTLIRNITDIDDKILAKAEQQRRPWYNLAYEMKRQLDAAYDALHVDPPTYEPAATGHVPEMIELILILIEAGHAYPAEDGSGDVYFDVRSWPAYGELTHQGIDDMEAASDADPRGKKDPRDFALWKGRKDSEPATASWPSPWGRGRPGWHIECSAMALKYLGGAFDIHGGGVDLRFPHHENEQAQSRAAGSDFASYWMHNAWITTSGEKMSKSLGNSLVVSAVLDRVRAIDLRFYIVAAHYRSHVEFSYQALEEAAAGFARIEQFLTRAAQLVEPGLAPVEPGPSPVEPGLAPVEPGPSPVEPGLAPVEPGLRPVKLVETLPDAFVAAMDDDLGTPAAVAVIYDAVREGNRLLTSGDTAELAATASSVRSMLAVLGLDPFDPHWSTGGSTDTEARLTAAVEALVATLLEQRAAARSAKDFAAADAIRDQLKAAGIDLEDTPQGPRWSM